MKNGNDVEDGTLVIVEAAQHASPGEYEIQIRHVDAQNCFRPYDSIAFMFQYMQTEEIVDNSNPKTPLGQWQEACLDSADADPTGKAIMKGRLLYSCHTGVQTVPKINWGSTGNEGWRVIVNMNYRCEYKIICKFQGRSDTYGGDLKADIINSAEYRLLKESVKALLAAATGEYAPLLVEICEYVVTLASRVSSARNKVVTASGQCGFAFHHPDVFVSSESAPPLCITPLYGEAGIRPPIYIEKEYMSESEGGKDKLGPEGHISNQPSFTYPKTSVARLPGDGHDIVHEDPNDRKRAFIRLESSFATSNLWGVQYYERGVGIFGDASIPHGIIEIYYDRWGLWGIDLVSPRARIVKWELQKNGFKIISAKEKPVGEK